MKKSILIFALSFIALVKSFAAPSEVLSVDVAQVFNNYYRAQEAQEKLQKVIDSAQEELNKMMESGMSLARELEELQSKFNNPALTEDARQRYMDQARPKAEELQKREQEINQFRQEKMTQFNQRRQAMFDLYLREISDAASKLAKKRDAKVVINSSAMLYSATDIDVTDELIRSLNTDCPKK